MNVADFKTTTINGGGSGFYSYLFASGINDMNGDNSLTIYPNPTNDKWFVSVAGTTVGNSSIQIFGADGKLMHIQSLQNGVVNTVNADKLPTGIYFYRVVTEQKTFTGNLLKN
jgi:hypothetical protein